jgi:hypothetical protein
MQNLSDNNFSTLTGLMQVSQASLLKIMKNYLVNKYQEVIATDEYILAKGDIPITLVAHMDTVFKQLPQEFFYDNKQCVLWSPQGLGADDRAGVFAIVQIIRAGYRPHIILTTDEECGALGASAVIRDYPESFAEMKYIIQLDRRGKDDCVFYDCDNPKFEKYIENFGFITNYGSFSDISILCPEWKIAGVNLSIGYEDEHSIAERLYISAMNETIARVIKMLEQEEIPQFEYIPANYYGWTPYYGIDKETWEKWCSPKKKQCHHCKKHLPEYDLIPVYQPSHKLSFYCTECIIDESVYWCEACGEAFIPADENNVKCCEKCAEELCKS